MDDLRKKIQKIIEKIKQDILEFKFNEKVKDFKFWISCSIILVVLGVVGFNMHFLRFISGFITVGLFTFIVFYLKID